MLPFLLNKKIGDALKAIGEGDHSGFDVLYNCIGRTVYLTAYSILGNEPDAADTVQDVFLKLYRNADRYDPDAESSATAYVLRIARNCALDRLRKRKEYVDIDSVGLAAQERDPGREEAAGKLGALLSALDDTDRQIVVMKAGVVQQIGEPQSVYDDPTNLFVAKFLGTPPINVFKGKIQGEKVYIGDAVVAEAPGVTDRNAYVGIRPEGFILDPNGPLECQVEGIDVMGRDISVISKHEDSLNVNIRSIIASEQKNDVGIDTVRFSIKPYKLFVFDGETEERIRL